MQLIESAAASLPLLSALPRLRCGSTCPRATGDIRTVGTPLVTSFRDGEDIVVVAEILGHSVETTRRYSLPTEQYKQRAIERLPVDQ